MRRLILVAVPAALLWLLVAAGAAGAASWEVQPTPLGTAAQGTNLAAVSCASSHACTAVGESPPFGLAERWDGTNWSVQQTPQPGGVNFLSGVSCPLTNVCIAVGWEGSSALVERWDGTSWQLQSTPNPAGSTASFLNGVSCTAENACTAVGFYSTSGGLVPLVERWNGTSWVLQSTPTSSGTSSLFNSVSCTRKRACTAVGYSGANGSGNSVALAERWNGNSWQVQTTPNPTGATLASFIGVSCSSGRACTAIGEYLSSADVFVPLVERWNGRNWSVQTTPNPTGTALRAVSCPSARACTAVGFQSTSGGSFALAERWDGTSWQEQPVPNPTGATGSSLDGVSCSAARTCTAVGDWTAAPTGTLHAASMTLAERYSSGP